MLQSDGFNDCLYLNFDVEICNLLVVTAIWIPGIPPSTRMRSFQSNCVQYWVLNFVSRTLK